MRARRLALTDQSGSSTPETVAPLPPGLLRAAELIGERWALLVLAVLIQKPRRFSQIRQALPAISANVLTTRLLELEERGLVRRTFLPKPPSVQVYEATDWALEAKPFIQSLETWASAH